MKVIRNNRKEITQEVKSLEPRRIVCEECESELEYTQSDTHIGAYGARYITCPCCNYENIIDTDDGIALTKDNVRFPKHYNHSGENAVKVSDEEIDKYVRRLIEEFRTSNDNNDWCRFTGTGDTLVTVYKFDGDEEYYVEVAKNYYETYIPFEVEDYK